MPRTSTSCTGQTPETLSPFEVRKRTHQTIIDGILADWPDARTRGFMAALKTLPDAEYITDMAVNDKRWWAVVSFVPDAYLIVPEKRHVVMFEAVYFNDVSDDKFAKMADLSWALDEDYYKLILVRCDRFHRRAYDVRGASLCSELEMIAANEPSQGWHVPDWQKYDYEYVAEYFKESAAA